MNKKNFVILFFYYYFIILLFFILSCQNSKIPTLPENNENIFSNELTTGKVWLAASSSNKFSPRGNFGLAKFEDRLWIAGGKSEDSGSENLYNDVWRSNNGIDWYIVTNNANFSPRKNHTLTYFNDYLWIIGGISDFESFKNDIYKSNNGKDWTKVRSAAPFYPRQSHYTIVFQNNLWVIGGRAYNYIQQIYTNDVWKSENGVDWECITNCANFSPRAGHICFVLNNELYVALGHDDLNFYSDVWKSSNGKNWQLVSDSVQISKRAYSQGFAFNNKLWLIGGIDNKGNYNNDVWNSVDGNVWLLITSHISCPSRIDFRAIDFNNKFWIFGGMNENGDYLNDIWYSE